MSETICQPNVANARFQLIPRSAGGLAVFVSCLVLIGWKLDVVTLRSVLPGQPEMVPNTALTFIIASVPLWMLWKDNKSQHASVVAWVCALLVVVVGLLTLIEYLTVSDLGFDRLLFRDRLQLTSYPGRPSPHTALSFLLIGSALLLIGKKTVRAWRLAQILALTTTLIALMALIGYIYQVAFLYRDRKSTRLNSSHVRISYAVFCLDRKSELQ